MKLYSIHADRRYGSRCFDHVGYGFAGKPEDQVNNHQNVALLCALYGIEESFRTVPSVDEPKGAFVNGLEPIFNPSRLVL